MEAATRPTGELSSSGAWSGVARAGRMAANVVFAVSVLTALVLLGGPRVARLLGLEVMVVTSGSMSPGIQPGDAVLIESVATEAIRPGDVITFQGRDRTRLTTHRVLEVVEIKDETWFRTKGDANDGPDPDLAAAMATRGRVRSVVPRVGPWVLLASSRWGPVVLIGIPAMILALQEAAALSRRRNNKEGRRWVAPSC